MDIDNETPVVENQEVKEKKSKPRFEVKKVR